MPSNSKNLCSQFSSLLLEFSCTNLDKICQLERPGVLEMIPVTLWACSHDFLECPAQAQVLLLSIIAPHAYIKILNSKDSYFIDYSLFRTMLLTEERIKALKYYCASNDTSECRRAVLAETGVFECEGRVLRDTITKSAIK